LRKGSGTWKIKGKILRLMNPGLNTSGDMAYTTKDYCLYGKKLYNNNNAFINANENHFVLNKN
jgi:hypothetical protein